MMFHTCDNPEERVNPDENAKSEVRKTEYDVYYEPESTTKWLKICNEGYRFDNGERFVELTCSSNQEWILADGSPIPRYYGYERIYNCYKKL